MSDPIVDPPADGAPLSAGEAAALAQIASRLYATDARLTSELRGHGGRAGAAQLDEDEAARLRRQCIARHDAAVVLIGITFIAVWVVAGLLLAVLATVPLLWFWPDSRPNPTEANLESGTPDL